MGWDGMGWARCDGMGGVGRGKVECGWNGSAVGKCGEVGWMGGMGLDGWDGMGGMEVG